VGPMRWWSVVPILLVVCMHCSAAAPEQRSKTPAATAGSARSKTPSGSFPTQKLKAMADETERTFLARAKVLADEREEKWKKKVLAFKVGRNADKIEERRDKVVREASKKKKEYRDMRKKAYKATLKADVNKGMAEHQTKAATQLKERRQKAEEALKEAVKIATRIHISEGPDAEMDRRTSSAMLAKLRIAQAHADGSLPGLSAEQRKNFCIVSLHAAIKHATGSPSKNNLQRALRMVRKSEECNEKESLKKVRVKNKRIAAKKAKERKMARLKRKRERRKVLMKKYGKQEKVGKKEERMSEVELPEKRRREMWTKKRDKEKRHKWMAFQVAQTQKLQEQAKENTDKHIQKEQGTKKEKQQKHKQQKEQCEFLSTRKDMALEKRAKAISAFARARYALLKESGSLKDMFDWTASSESDEYRLDTEEQDLGESSSQEAQTDVGEPDEQREEEREEAKLEASLESLSPIRDSKQLTEKKREQGRHPTLGETASKAKMPAPKTASTFKTAPKPKSAPEAKPVAPTTEHISAQTAASAKTTAAQSKGLRTTPKAKPASMGAVSKARPTAPPKQPTASEVPNGKHSSGRPTASTKPTVPKAKTAMPKAKPATTKQKHVAPKAKTVMPKAKPVTPIQNPVAPKAKTAMPKARPAAPKKKPTAPKAKTTMPKAKPAAPKKKPAAPKAKTAMPKAKPAAPKKKPTSQNKATSKRLGQTALSTADVVKASAAELAYVNKHAARAAADARICERYMARRRRTCSCARAAQWKRTSTELLQTSGQPAETESERVPQGVQEQMAESQGLGEKDGSKKDDEEEYYFAPLVRRRRTNIPSAVCQCMR